MRFHIVTIFPDFFTGPFQHGVVRRATLAGLLFAKDRKPIPWVTGTVLLLLFSIHITVTTMVGYVPELSWGKWDWVSKALLMTFVSMTLFQDRVRLRWLYMVAALGLGF